MPEQQFHLAQFNVSKMRAPLDSPIMRGFVEQLVPIHELADNSPGFVWRYQEENGHSSAVRPYSDPLIMINLSVWESVESLKQFTYRTKHLQVIRDGKKWFEPYDGQPYLAMWWTPKGHLPAVQEAMNRLEWLKEKGGSSYAFGWKNIYSPPEKP